MSPGPLREFRTASDECTGPENEATAHLHVRHKPYATVTKHMPGILFLVRFNNFDQTVGFYWNYMLLL